MTEPTVDPRLAEMARLGARAKALRNTAGLSQTQVAERVGVTRLTISRFEAGQNDLGSSRLALLAAAIGIAPADLWN